jgi:SAM-dependent methyltransferase
MTQFDQSQYWVDRHQRLPGDPRSVGNLGRSLEENQQSEVLVREVVERATRLLSPARTALDLGCGYGRVSQCFTDKGYHYLGVDVSPDAIQFARKHNPAAEFQVGDLSKWTTDRRFDVVCVLYVFIHFVADAEWLSLLERALSWVAPAGALLMADEFPKERELTGLHVVSRPLQEYEAILELHGFRFDEAFREQLIGSGDQLLRHARPFRLARRGN